MKQQIALNVDCMEYMRTLPDKAFDLAIVDPPYGISIHDSGRLKKYNATETRWDDATPGDVYFSELKRCSKNQIIWGGNYYDLPPCRGFVIWDKKQPEDISFASCEFAWTSFDTSMRDRSGILPAARAAVRGAYGAGKVVVTWASSI